MSAAESFQRLHDLQQAALAHEAKVIFAGSTFGAREESEARFTRAFLISSGGLCEAVPLITSLVGDDAQKRSCCR